MMQPGALRAIRSARTMDDAGGLGGRPAMAARPMQPPQQPAQPRPMAPAVAAPAPAAQAPMAPAVSGLAQPAAGGPNMNPAPVNAPQLPSAPATPPATGGVATTAINPASDLRGQQIAPTVGADEGAARAIAAAKLQEAANGPDRGQLAMQNFNLYRDQTEPQFQTELRQVGQKAAALGRIGAGMTTSELGDVATLRNRDLNQRATQLMGDAAGQTVADRLAVANTGMGFASGFRGLDQGARDELRGERGYQAGMAQQGVDNAVRQRTLEEDLLDRQYGRQRQQTMDAAGIGYGYDPTAALMSGAQMQGAQAAQTQSGVGDLLQAYFRNRTLSQVYGGQGGQPTAPPAGSAVSPSAVYNLFNPAGV